MPRVVIDEPVEPRTTFLGVPFERVGQSARMWFKNSDLAQKFGIGAKVLANKMRNSDASPFRALSVDIDDLRVYLAKDRVRLEHAPEVRFDLDYYLAAIFTLPTESARHARDWVVSTLNKLVYDGFVALDLAPLDMKLQRALVAHVCDVEHYYAVACDRFDPADEARGTNYSPKQLTEELLLTPDSYLTREEISTVKALTLAIQLLTMYRPDVSLTALLNLYGIDAEALAGTDEQREQCHSWLREHHNNTRSYADAVP